VPIPRTPERQRIDQRLAQDHLLRALDPGAIEHAPMRTRQVQVQRRALAQAFRDLAPVHLGRMALRIQHRDHQRPGEVLVPTRPQQPDALQLPAHRRARLRVHRRQPVRERAIGEAQPEARDQFRIVQAAARQVRLRLRTLAQVLVVDAHDGIQQRLVILARRQIGTRPLLAHPPRRPIHRRTPLDRIARQRRVFLQQLHRVPEAHLVPTHHPVDHRTARLTRAQAVPQVRLRADHQRRRAVVVERTATDPVLAVRLQPDPRRLHQPLQAHRQLQPLDLGLGDAGHGAGSSRKCVKTTLLCRYNSI